MISKQTEGALNMSNNEYMHSPMVSLLEKISIPCLADKKTGKFEDTSKLKLIDEEITNANCNYRLVEKGKKRYRLYAQDELEVLAKDFSSVVLVSSHADNLQKKAVFEKYKTEKGIILKGIFDNAATNAAATYIMTNMTMPRNVLFAFTSDEEEESRGAQKLAKKLKEHFEHVEVIVLDVTYGWQNEADFTIENDYFSDTQVGMAFAKRVCEMANESGMKYNFLYEAEKDDEENYINSQLIKSFMGDNYMKDHESEGPDESEDYAEKGFDAFSLCLPCSANSEEEMHSQDGFEISIKVLSNYTEFLGHLLESYNS